MGYQRTSTSHLLLISQRRQVPAKHRYIKTSYSHECDVDAIKTYILQSEQRIPTNFNVQMF